jgi:Zn finger protein HypA/HybF involved in hydrogenase expression
MADIKSFNDYKEEQTPHIVSEVVCLSCLHRWISVRPQQTLLKQLECPNCHKAGYVIATGEQLSERKEK